MSDLFRAGMLGREGHKKRGLEKSSKIQNMNFIWTDIVQFKDARCSVKILALSESEVAHELLDIWRGRGFISLSFDKENSTEKTVTRKIMNNMYNVKTS